MKKILLLTILLSFAFAQTPFEQLREQNKEKFEKKYNRKLELIGDTSVYQPETKPNWNSESQYFLYQEVVNDGVKDLTKDELYNLAMRWVVKTFNSANNVVQLNDRESGNIIIKGNLTTRDSYPDEEEYALDEDFKDSTRYLDITIPITLDIKTKDGRYKYKITVYQRSESGYKTYGGPLMGGILDIDYSTKTFTNFDFNEYVQTVRSKQDYKYPIDYYSLVDKQVKGLIASLQLSILSELIFDNDDDW